MPEPKLHAPTAWGAKNLAEYGYSQVIEVDGRVELAGKGGGAL